MVFSRIGLFHKSLEEKHRSYIEGKVQILKDILMAIKKSIKEEKFKIIFFLTKRKNVLTLQGAILLFKTTDYYET